MSDDPNAGGAGGNEITLETPGVADLIKAAVTEATSGLETNRNELLGEKKTMQDELNSLKKTWGDLDAEAVKSLMSRMENDEETRLLAEGKVDEVIEKRMERLTAEHAAQVDALTGKLTESESGLGNANGIVKNLLVSNGVTLAAAEMKDVVPSAIGDIVARASSVFGVEDINNASLVAKGPDGVTMYGKDGKTSLTVAEWLGTQREKAPHWFAPSGGAGSGGGKGPGGGGSVHTISKADALNTVKYNAAKDAADKAGVPLQILTS